MKLSRANHAKCNKSQVKGLRLQTQRFESG